MSVKVVREPLTLNWPQQAENGIRLLMVQADLRPLEKETNSGFRYPTVAEERQLAVLRSSLAIANSGQKPKSQFVLLPEYALPSARFLDCEQIVQENLPNNAICIAGFDGFSQNRWEALLEDGKTKHVGQLKALTDANSYRWVNAAAIWVKDNQGEFRRYLQVKLHPAPDEEFAPNMLKGNQIYYFDVGAHSFAILICFDLMANLGELKTGARIVAEWLYAEKATDTDRPLMLWVLQHNDNPDNDLMRAAVNQVLSVQNKATVVFVNGAQEDGDSGWQTGVSRFYLSKGFYPPTEKQTPLQKLLPVYRRVRTGDYFVTTASLRMGKPALHTLTYYPPGALPLDPGSSRQLVEPEKLFLLGEGAPEETDRIEACHHAVDDVVPMADPRLTQCGLSSDKTMKKHLGTSYDEVLKDLASLNITQLYILLQTLFQSQGTTPNPDYWSVSEAAAVRKLIQALLILKAGGIDPSIVPLSKALVTAHCGRFTISVVQGNREQAPDSFLHLVEDIGYTGAGRHVLWLLEHNGTLGAISPVDVHPTGHYAEDQDDILDHTSGEERAGLTRLYYYSHSELETLVRKAGGSATALKQLMEEVFTWQIACA